VVDTRDRNAGVEQGVGRTALMVAAARAMETHRHDSLAQDVYAEHFVRSARASADWPVRIEDAPGGDANPLWGRLGRYFGLRTRVLDDHLLRSVRAGIHQVVLLGAGLDSRVFRLDWPPDRVVFEVDQDGVLEFKRTVLANLGATPRTTYRSIAADLRGDWSAALIDAGYDATVPSAWLIEGVLLYLPSAAERRLIDVVHRLTAVGSTLAYEIKIDAGSPELRQNHLYTTAKRQIDLDLPGLFAAEPRPDSLADLTSRGWSAKQHSPYDYTRHHGRGPRPEPNDALGGLRWVFADKPTAGG
jgi:methyltransferase (TIGR00027 family)